MDRFTVSTLIHLSNHIGSMKGYMGGHELSEELSTIGCILMEMAVRHVDSSYFNTEEKQEAWGQIEELVAKL